MKEMDRLSEEVARLYYKKVDDVLGVRLVDVLNNVRGSGFLKSSRAGWVVYLDGLSEHGVRRVGRLSFLVLGCDEGDVAIEDPILGGTVVLVPKVFAEKVVVLGGFP